MKEQLIESNTAKLAKEKGFNEITDYMYGNQVIPQVESYNKTKMTLYDDYYLAPTQSLLQKWLRETQVLNIEIMFGSRTWDKFDYYHGHVHRGGNGIHVRVNYEKDSFYPDEKLSYEECLEKLLFEALKLI